MDEYVSFDPRIPSFKPFLTRILVSLIIIAYFVEVIYKIKLGPEAIILLGAKYNPGIEAGEYWRFITSAFLHGNLIHLLLNTVALNLFGNEIEAKFGSSRFMLTFLLSCWGAGLASYLYSPAISIGASGGLFGLVGALTSYYYKQKERIATAKLKFKSMYTLLLINIVLGFIIPGIDNAGHFGGLVTGILLGFYISPTYTTKKIEEESKLIIVEEKSGTRIFCGFLLASSILFLLTGTFVH